MTIIILNDLQGYTIEDAALEIGGGLFGADGSTSSW